MAKSFKNIDEEIKHHVEMAAYHSHEATQLLKKKGDVSTSPTRKGAKASEVQALLDYHRAKASGQVHK